LGQLNPPVAALVGEPYATSGFCHIRAGLFMLASWVSVFYTPDACAFGGYSITSHS
jgi:hypothetical protein